MKIIPAKPSYLSKAKSRLFMLSIACTLAMAVPSQGAKPAYDKILISSGIADPILANIGQEVTFSAGYISNFQDTYKLYACKSREFDDNTRNCQDGAWCESPEFTNENPLSCKYTASAQDNLNNPFYIFVCSQNNGCSPYFPGFFAIVENFFLNLRAPEQLDFKAIPFSFQKQESAGNKLGDIIVSSYAKNVQWSVNLTAQDWQNEKGESMDYDGNGNSTGQLTVDLSEAAIESILPTENLMLGQTTSFSPLIKNINILSTGKKVKSGIFTIKNIMLNQTVPENQKEGDYKTVLTFTIS